MQNRVMEKQKLGFGFWSILEQALRIPFRNSHFIIFTFLTSIPLFMFLVSNEKFLQTTLAETLEILTQNPEIFSMTTKVSIHVTTRMAMEISFKLCQLGLCYLVPLYLQEHASTVGAVILATGIYTGDWVKKPVTRARLTGILFTFIYSVLLSATTMLGSIWLAVNYYIILRNYFYNMFFALLYRAACVAMITKYLEMSAVWNMATVIPILEEKYGAEAFMLSAHYNRGNERSGTLLMFVFLVWGIGLRLPCFFIGCNGNWSVIVVQAILFCVGNVMKWVTCVVYFYNCKQGMLENVDEEVGRDYKAVDLEYCEQSAQNSQTTRVEIIGRIV